MALGGILGAALTDHGARAYSLWIDGLDVLREPGAPTGARYGAPLSSIKVREQGPNAVSSMSFVLDDPGLSVAFKPGARVLFWDHGENAPIFRGFLERWSVRPDFGQIARSIEVDCVGVEILLDWAIVPAMNYPIGTDIASLVMQLASVLPDVTIAQAVTPFPSEFAGVPSIGTILYATVEASGVTLRQAILSLAEAGPTFVSAAKAVTIDFYGYLRLYEIMPITGYAGVGTYTGVFYLSEAGPFGAVTDRMESLTYTIDVSPVVRAVWVQGTGVAGWVTDGTGLPGASSYLADADVTTEAQRLARGSGYLATLAPTVRGSVEMVIEATMTGTLRRHHAGSTISLTSASVGFPAGTLQSVVGTLDIEFTGGKTEQHTITFGGVAPSSMALVRRLTRDTLS